MKKCYLLFLLLISMTSFSQQIGEYKLNFVKKFTDENLKLKDQWLDGDTFYVIYFKKNTIGVKHAIDLATEILNVNNQNIDKPFKDKSYLPASVKNIYDYEHLDFYSGLGKAEVSKSWLIDNRVVLLQLNDETYQIVISK